MKDLPRDSYIISDKLTPQCADYTSKTPVEDMLTTEYEMLGIDNMDIYWVHNPVDAPKWITEVAKYFEGKENVPVIGVSNHNLAEIKEADKILKEHGLKLGAVQNHYSLLNRSSEDSGIVDYCKENGIQFWAYMV
ncbi:MAG: aldo/keto reductase, partial [Lachnospiraceae bacterium]|nr:aldo/keto reductase [Lachnospiraceae bacterium]